MPKISREIFRDFAEKGFFDNLKTTQQVLNKFDSRGFTIKGKKAGLVGQLLTFLCQEGLLEREKNDEGNWSFRKI